MLHRRRTPGPGGRTSRGALLVAVAAMVAGCGVPSAPGTSLSSTPPRPSSGASPSPTPTATPSAADEHTLHEALSLWAGFPVNASPRPLILLGGAQQTVSSSDFGFSSGDAKLALYDGQIHPPVAWPASPGEADGYPLITAAEAFEEFTPPPGTESPPTATWLHVTAVQLETAAFESDRGDIQLPAWAFTFDQSSGSIAVLAITPASVYAVPASLTSATGTALAGEAELGSEGRTLTGGTGGWESGTGPCEATYSLQVAESVTAVALVVDEQVHPPPSGEACAVQADPVQLTAVLAEPLGSRVVVNADAEAVVVTADGAAG